MAKAKQIIGFVRQAKMQIDARQWSTLADDCDASRQTLRQVASSLEDSRIEKLRRRIRIREV